MSTTLSNAVAPTFNRAIKRLSEDDPQINADLVAIADQAVAEFGSSVKDVAGRGEVILSTEDQWHDGVVKYESDIAVVIKDGQAVWVGRQLEKIERPMGRLPSNYPKVNER